MAQTGFEQLKSWLSKVVGKADKNGKNQLHIADPRFDSWEVVRDFSDLKTARAWRQRLDELGIEGVITADWPLDRFGRGDIALRVEAKDWSEAEAILDNL